MLRDKTFIGLNIAVFLMMLGVGMIVALLPQRIITLSGTGATVGYLASAFAISYILFQLPIGYLSDRLGFKPLLLAGYILCFITGAVYYFSASANSIFLGRMIQGVGEAPVWALAPALLSIKYPLNKGKAMGFYNASLHTGLTIGPILGIILSKELLRNQPFLFYALVCLAGAIILFFTVENVSPINSSQKNSMSLKELKLLVSSKSVLISLIGISLYGAGYGAFLTVIPAFLLKMKNFGPTDISIFFSLFYVAISISQLITGPLSDKMGRKVFMIIGLLIAAISIFIFPTLTQPWISLLLSLGSLGLGLFCISSMANLNDIVPDSLKGTISGAYYLFWGIGMFFGPALISGLLSNSNTIIGFYSMAGMMIVAAIFMCSNSTDNKTGISIKS